MPDDIPIATEPEPGVIIIAGRRYITPQKFCDVVGVTTRTYQRWQEKRIGPPRARIGNLDLIDEAKLPDWLASHEQQPVRQPRRRRKMGGGDDQPAA